MHSRPATRCAPQTEMLATRGPHGSERAEPGRTGAILQVLKGPVKIWCTGSGSRSHRSCGFRWRSHLRCARSRRSSYLGRDTGAPKPPPKKKRKKANSITVNRPRSRASQRLSGWMPACTQYIVLGNCLLSQRPQNTPQTPLKAQRRREACNQEGYARIP